MPVSAADGETMLYNGVELPNIDTVWTDKETYPYAMTAIAHESGGDWYYLFLTDTTNLLIDVSNNGLYGGGSVTVSSYYLMNGIWQAGNTFSISNGLLYRNTTEPFWANYDFYTTNDTIYLSATAPVDPNAPVESPIMDILSVGADSSSVHANFNVSGVSSDSLYTITASCFLGEQVVGSSAAGPYSGPEFETTVSVGGLSPSTEYTVEYQLSKDGEYTGVSQTVTVTTAAGSGSGSGDDTGDSGSCACPSILNSILSAITTQTNFLSTWQQTWTTRMDSFESTLSKLIPVPDPTETALKDSTKETTQAVNDSLFADDAPTKVTASDVKDVAEIGSAASSMFDSGVSIGSFFDALNNIRFIAFFSQETYDDLNTVQSISTYSRDNESGYVDYYSENLDMIQTFVGGE